MPSLLDTITQQLDGDTLNRLATQAGAGESQVQEAAPLALASLVEGLSRNASRPEGAEALLGALTRDHDGSVLDNLGGFFGQPNLQDGESILGHVFGNRQQQVAQGLSQKTGLDMGSVLRLLATLAPVVMGFLGREQRRQGLSGDGLSSVLGQEREAAQRQAPGGMDLLAGILDQDGDGQVADDVARIGGGLFSKLFRRR